MINNQRRVQFACFFVDGGYGFNFYKITINGFLSIYYSTLNLKDQQ